MNTMRAIHPGKILGDEIEELGISATAFSKKLAVPPNRITSILNGTRSITADTALRLTRFFGTSPEFWMNLQIAYDLKVTAQNEGREINRAIKPMNKVA